MLKRGLLWGADCPLYDSEPNQGGGNGGGQPQQPPAQQPPQQAPPALDANAIRTIVQGAIQAQMTAFNEQLKPLFDALPNLQGGGTGGAQPPQQQGGGEGTGSADLPPAVKAQLAEAERSRKLMETKLNELT